jgi:hypothetical protein
MFQDLLGKGYISNALLGKQGLDEVLVLQGWTKL